MKTTNHICPACNKVFLRCLGQHFIFSPDKKHQEILDKQELLVTKLFLNGNSPLDIEKRNDIFMNNKWILRVVKRRLGKEKALKLSWKIHGKKRKRHWQSMSLEERKLKMAPVRKAEWGHLTPEQRKKHPWVIAGRLGSLKSSKRGSKNQIHAFELLTQKMPYLDWVYNHALDENWQIDIAAPNNKIFIEWDGRHHRIPIHGQGSLNNRKNRDRIKDKIIIRQLKGTMIRVEDNGRFNPKFVDDITDEIVDLIEGEKLKERVYLFENFYYL